MISCRILDNVKIFGDVSHQTRKRLCGQGIHQGHILSVTDLNVALLNLIQHLVILSVHCEPLNL